MQVTIEEIEPCKVAVNLEFEAEKIQDIRREVLKRLSRTIVIPGFRPGKAPLSMVERYVGEELKEHLVNTLVSRSLPQALQESKISILPDTRPVIEPGPYEEGKPFRLKAIITTLPKVELKEYKGLKIEYPAATVTEETVEQRLRDYQRALGRFTSVERPAEYNDLITLRVLPSEEGFSLPGPQNLRLLLDRKHPLSLLLVGVEKGAEVEVPETLLYGGETETSKIIKVRIEEIYGWQEAELNDDLAKEVGSYNSLAELREDIRQHLEAKAEALNQSAQKEALFAELRKRNPVHIPLELVTSVVSEDIAEFVRNLRREGLELQDYLQQNRLSLEDFQRAQENRARSHLALEYLLEAIAEREGITLSPPEDRPEQRAMTISEYYRSVIEFLLEQNEFVPISAEAEPVQPPAEASGSA